jgi:predicted SAM-dependent methyltransferase
MPRKIAGAIDKSRAQRKPRAVAPQLLATPTAVVRYQNGTFTIDAGGGRTTAVKSDDPRLAAVLRLFAAPADPEAAIAASGIDRVFAKRAIALLRQIGALAPAGHKTRTVARERHVQNRSAHHLTELATAAYLLAGDILAFDEATCHALAEHAGIGTANRIEALVGQLEMLQSEFDRYRQNFIASHLKALGIRRGARGLKVNVGCGKFPIPSWVNIDLYPAELPVSLRWGLPLPDGSAEYVFMSHAMEHLYHPGESLAIAREIYRVLQPGGRARIVVTDFEKWVNAYAERDANFFEGRKAITPMASRGTWMEQLLIYCGSGEGAHPTYFFGHKVGFDFETMRNLLKRAGFTSIERSDYMASRHKALRVDQHSHVAHAEFEGGRYSLFVEAERPTRARSKKRS